MTQRHHSMYFLCIIMVFAWTAAWLLFSVGWPCKNEIIRQIRVVIEECRWTNIYTINTQWTLSTCSKRGRRWVHIRRLHTVLNKQAWRPWWGVKALVKPHGPMGHKPRGYGPGVDTLDLNTAPPLQTTTMSPVDNCGARKHTLPTKLWRLAWMGIGEQNAVEMKIRVFWHIHNYSAYWCLVSIGWW